MIKKDKTIKHFADLKNTKHMGDLKQKITFFRENNNLSVFHFASSRGREGVSTVVTNLAEFMAGEGVDKDILLIDANLQRPALHTVFDIPLSPGMNDAVMGKATYPESIYKVELDRINVMPCGTPSSHIPGKIEQKKFSDLIAAIKGKYDYIFIDSSPLLESSDSLPLAIVSDTTFLVIQANKTQWEVAEQAKLYLQNNGCHIGGVILNRVSRVIPQWIYKKL